MRKMIARPWVILLAAGGSRRFGRPKLLARIDGETLLRRAARAALGCAPAGCVVVLGAHAARLERELAGLPLRTVVNRSWRSGLAGSLRAGIFALPLRAPAALILLADQVAIGPEDLVILIATWRRVPHWIVAANAGGFRCPPAILPRAIFRKIRSLRGDEGARTLLRDLNRRVVDVDLPNAASDVDRPADLKRFVRSRAGWRRG